MKKFRSLLFLAPLSFLLLWAIPVASVPVLTGCASITSGDPVVVRTEQAMSLAFDTMDAFVKFEHLYNSKGELGPDVRNAAEKIRAGAPKWMATAKIMLQTYKNNRTEENKANLMTALAMLQAGASEATKYLSTQK